MDEEHNRTDFGNAADVIVAAMDTEVVQGKFSSVPWATCTILNISFKPGGHWRQYETVLEFRWIVRQHLEPALPYGVLLFGEGESVHIRIHAIL